MSKYIKKKNPKKNKELATIKKEVPKIKYERMFGNQFNLKYDSDFIERIADEMWVWFQIKDNVWLKDFSISKMINQSRIGEFVKKNEYFAYLHSLCMELQESKLFKFGFSKKINVAMPILALKANHKWSDQPQTQIEISPHQEFDSWTDEQLKEYLKKK